MSSESFHLHFTSKMQTFDIDFEEKDKPSTNTVLINGRHYCLSGDTFKISWLKQKIPSLSGTENTTFEELEKKISELGATDLSISRKVDILTKPFFSHPLLDVSAASEAYLLATEDPLEAHAEVGILRPDGQTLSLQFGKTEVYGAHRIGSVTKMFTAFLALKLINDGVINLTTRCGDLIEDDVLKAVFSNFVAAKEMTLEQLLTHTSGLEYDDQPIGGPFGTNESVKLPSLNDRFIHQAVRNQKRLSDKYKHKHLPGEKVGLYSNLGFDVAAWMMELAYNKSKGPDHPPESFAQIIQNELFGRVFELSSQTRISPGPSGHGDLIQAGCGDMVSSVEDLLKVGQILQQGEEFLEPHLGKDWQAKLLASRDAEGKYGLGCEANKSSLQFSGLNYEIFEDGKGKDVTAHVAFPIRKGQPGIIAMCDSNALGPDTGSRKFCNELRKLAGLEEL